jgi:hypothetical protein
MIPFSTFGFRVAGRSKDVKEKQRVKQLARF